MKISLAFFSQNHTRFWQLLLPLLFTVLTLVIAAGFLFRTEDEPPRKIVQSSQPVVVTGMTVTQSAEPPPLRLHGTVTPRYRLQLSTEVSGKVVFLNRKFVVGGYVKAGELLIGLDDSSYRYELTALKAELASADLELQREMERASLAARDWREFGHGIAPPLVLRTPQLAAARATFEKAEADLKRATLEQQKTAIRAPFDALVVGLTVSPGSVVSAGAPVAELFSTSSAEIRLPVSPQQAALIRLPAAGEQEAVTISWKQGTRPMLRQGYLVRSEGFFDPHSRFTHALVEVPDPYALQGAETALAMGRFVEVALPLVSLTGAVQLPETALVDEHHILRVNSYQQLEYVPVTLVHRYGDSIVVTGALKAGDTIVSVPPAYPVAGMKVRVVPAEKDPSHG